MAAWSARLKVTWAQSEQAGRPQADLLDGDGWPTTSSPLLRLREVEVHHVDLGLGYEPGDWPEDYVRWELPGFLEELPERLAGPADERRLLAWLVGRTPWPDGLQLGPGSNLPHAALPLIPGDGAQEAADGGAERDGLVEPGEVAGVGDGDAGHGGQSLFQ